MMAPYFFRQVFICSFAVAALVNATAYAQGAASASAPQVSVSQPSAPKVPTRKSKKVIVPDESISPASLKARYPAGSIIAVDQADRAIAEVKKGRELIEARFKREEKACYDTFLANRCVAQAKDRRRLALAEIQPIEVQANRFKRHDAVVKRDKVLETRRLKEQGKSRTEVDTHAQKFETKQQQNRLKEKSAAEKRTENEAAFQKKVQDREAAQRKVEEKRAKTERRRQKKAASAAAKKRAQPSALPVASAEK